MLASHLNQLMFLLRVKTHIDTIPNILHILFVMTQDVATVEHLSQVLNLSEKEKNKAQTILYEFKSDLGVRWETHCMDKSGYSDIYRNDFNCLLCTSLVYPIAACALSAPNKSVIDHLRIYRVRLENFNFVRGKPLVSSKYLKCILLFAV